MPFFITQQFQCKRFFPTTKHAIMGPLFYFGGGRMDGIPTRNLTLAFGD